MNEMIQKAFAFIEENREPTLRYWRDLVLCEGKTGELEQLKIAAEKVRIGFEKTGFAMKLVDVGDAGPTVVGVLGADRPGKPILFGGHYDTVFPAGSWGEEPFTVEDGIVRGPGALDMKGGITVALMTCKALQAAGYTARPIKVVFSGDEENGHIGSRGGEVFLQECEGALCGFNMETGQPGNGVCMGRKKPTNFVITVKGVSCHAGNDFERGRNAIWEAAHKVIQLQALTDLKKGTTVNCGVIEGGTVPNAVPEQCIIQVDTRVAEEAELARLIAAIEAITAGSTIEGTTAAVQYNATGGMPMFNPTKESMELYQYCDNISQKYGLGALRYSILGGGSDAGFMAKAGVPCICSFGVMGENNHTKQEYAQLESLYTRAKLLAAAIIEMEI